MLTANAPQNTIASELKKDVRILVKHLPTFISNEALRELFLHYGSENYQIFDSGKMAGCAIVSYSDVDAAERAVKELNQLELFGKTLKVEYIKRPKRKKYNQRTPFEALAPDLGVSYPSDPTLEYTYPEASPSIIANISNALLHVPRFYTQALHLMNKMNLPPPFGPASNFTPKNLENIKKRKLRTTSSTPTTTSAPAAVPSAPSSSASSKPKRADLSSSESELESDEDEEPRAKQNRVVPTSAELAHAEHLQQQQHMQQIHAQHLHQQQQHQKVPHILYPTQPLQQPAAIAPLAAPAPGWDVISLEELNAHRVPFEELRVQFKLDIDDSQPRPKLYIKNLSKSVTVQHLERVFGRYFSSEADMRNGLEIRLLDGKMKGQAFLSFPDASTAQRALRECQGYVLIDKPLAIQYGKAK